MLCAAIAGDLQTVTELVCRTAEVRGCKAADVFPHPAFGHPLPVGEGPLDPYSNRAVAVNSSL